MRLVWNRGVEYSFRAEGFFGREKEILALERLAELGRLGEGGCVLLYGPPNIGKSSLLLKFKEILIEQKEDVSSEKRLFPFYFSFSKALANPFRLAHSFILEYMWQLVAFLGEPIEGGFDSDELGERLSSLGVTVPFEHIKGVENFTELNDPVSAVATALSFPFALEKGNISDIFIFDDFQYSMKISDMPEWAVLSVLRPYIKSGNIPFIISGSSPGAVTANLKKEGLFGSFSLMEIGSLTREFAENHLRYLLDRRKIKLDDGVVGRITKRLGGVPIYQRLFVDELTFSGASVKDDSDVENLYAQSVVDGKLNRYWREFFEACLPDRKLLAKAVKFLKRVLVDDFPIHTYEGTFGLVGGDAEKGEKIIAALEFRGLVKSDFEHLSFVRDGILSDFLFWAYERGVLSKPNNQVVSQIVQKNIFRARYPHPKEQKSAVLGPVKEMLRKWDCQEVPASIFDFPSFKERYGNKGALEVLIGIEEEKMKYLLPKISSVSAGYMIGGKLPRVDFDIVAFGFRNREYTEESLVIWAVDFISGKVLTRAKLEHFENRCRLLSLEKSLTSDHLVKWVIFEGKVDAETLAYASSCGIFLSHAKQLKILFNLFDVEEVLEEEKREAREPLEKREVEEGPLEFDLVIPMREDAEVIAAKVVEEITHFTDVDRDTVDKIKMAIIEACINAFEHSEAEDGLVKLRYIIADDKLEVFITDEGKGFKAAKTFVGKEDRKKNRGWGLKIIKELVDDVEILTGDRGTTIRMIKYLDQASGDEFVEQEEEQEPEKGPDSPITDEGGDSGTET